MQDNKYVSNLDLETGEVFFKTLPTNPNNTVTTNYNFTTNKFSKKPLKQTTKFLHNINLKTKTKQFKLIKSPLMPPVRLKSNNKFNYGYEPNRLGFYSGRFSDEVFVFDGHGKGVPTTFPKIKLKKGEKIILSCMENCALYLDNTIWDYLLKYPSQKDIGNLLFNDLQSDKNYSQQFCVYEGEGYEIDDIVLYPESYQTTKQERFGLFKLPIKLKGNYKHNMNHIKHIKEVTKIKNTLDKQGIPKYLVKNKETVKVVSPKYYTSWYKTHKKNTNSELYLSRVINYIRKYYENRGMELNYTLIALVCRSTPEQDVEKRIINTLSNKYKTFLTEKSYKHSRFSWKEYLKAKGLNIGDIRLTSKDIDLYLAFCELKKLDPNDNTSKKYFKQFKMDYIKSNFPKNDPDLDTEISETDMKLYFKMDPNSNNNNIPYRKL